MSEHAIPQNVMSFKYKLFAGLTAKQFVFAAIGGSGTFLFLQLTLKGLIPAIFGWPLTLISLLFALGFTLFSYEKRPLDEWIQEFIRIMRLSLIMVWKRTDKAVKLDPEKRYKPEKLPEYLSIYFQTSKTIGTFKKKLEKHLSQQQKHQTISIDPSNYSQYSVSNIKLPEIPNTVAFRLVYNNAPLAGVVAYLKDINNKTIRALKSTQNGIIYFNQTLRDGTYHIAFKSDNYTFPDVIITFKQTTYPLFNIVPTENE